MTNTTDNAATQPRTETDTLFLPELYETCSHCNGDWLKPNPAYDQYNKLGRRLLAAAIEAREAAGLSGGEESPEIIDAQAPYTDRTVVDPLHDKFGTEADRARTATLAWRMHQQNPPKWPNGHPQEEEFYCMECHGHSGYQLTAAGRQVLDLLRIFKP
ncbi:MULTISPECIES: hypothetical protein [unclassified Streptomyces]|uniref:hypothetical protein n=1 Tax=unclassified Streptomyces TaxID=2593676 RepID=UPI0033B5E610